MRYTVCTLALLLGILLLGNCSSSPRQGAATAAHGQELADRLDATLHSISVGEIDLHYAEAGEKGKPTVVFIHGTPGSWRALGRLLGHPQLRSAARLIAVDRPGWGGSRLPDEGAEGSFAAQVKLMVPLLRQLKEDSGDQAVILVGHSLGASYAAYIAYRHPELVDGILMAAGAIAPELGKPRWYNYAAKAWPISRLIAAGLRKANVEIWGVHAALEELEPWWRTASIPMIYLQGEQDELVDPRNLDYAETVLPPEHTRVVRIPEQGHFVHRQQEQLIAELTLELLGVT